MANITRSNEKKYLPFRLNLDKLIHDQRFSSLHPILDWTKCFVHQTKCFLSMQKDWALVKIFLSLNNMFCLFFHADFHFQVTGGWPAAGQKTTEFVEPANSDTGSSGSATIGPNLPEKRRGHCAVVLHDGSVMFIGNDGCLNN